MTPQEQYDKLRNAEAPAAPALPPDIIRVIAAQYRTTDGHLFDSVEGAEAHAKELRFNRWYADLPDGLFGSGSVGSVDGADLWDWLVLNKAKVLEFLA